MNDTEYGWLRRTLDRAVGLRMQYRHNPRLGALVAIDHIEQAMGRKKRLSPDVMERLNTALTRLRDAAKD